MYLYFDNGGTLRTLIPHGEIPRQGNPLNLYLCFNEDRFDEESRQNFIIKIRFTFPDGTLSNEYTINPLQTDLNNNGYYLGLQQFEKLSDSEITFALKPGMEYHMFKYGFTGADRITTLYGKVLIHISFVYKEYDEEGNVLGENVYEENGTFHIERTIGSNLKQSVITPDEYTELQDLINRYILEFNDITFITDVESLESVELPDIRHLYRVRNAEGKLEYYNYRYEEWHRFVTGGEFAVLSATVKEQGDKIENLETLTDGHETRIQNAESEINEINEGLEEETNKRINAVNKLQEKIDAEAMNRYNSDKNLQDQIDAESEARTSKDTDVQNQINNNKTEISKKISTDFSNLAQASKVHKDDSIIIRCNGTTYTITVSYLSELLGTGVSLFKGYFSTVENLVANFPKSEAGSYAFVGSINDEQYHMYVWDDLANDGEGVWEETISGQYVGTSTFDTFQQRLQEGLFHVGAIKGNIENPSGSSPLLYNIEINGEQYVIPNIALDFLGNAVEGAYKLGAIKINGDTWNINNDIVTLEMSDENVDGAYELGSIVINGNKWNVLKASFVDDKIAELRAYIEANNFNKGEFLSFEKLQEKYPEGSPGEFAFVNTPTNQGDVMLMYVWDDDSNTWRETTSNQYVLNSTFEQFKEQVNSVLNITDALTFELSSERQEGANELGSIRIGEDVWNMPQGGSGEGENKIIINKSKLTNVYPYDDQNTFSALIEDTALIKEIINALYNCKNVTIRLKVEVEIGGQLTIINNSWNSIYTIALGTPERPSMYGVFGVRLYASTSGSGGNTFEPYAMIEASNLGLVLQLFMQIDPTELSSIDYNIELYFS